MSDVGKITEQHRRRRAVVYVRQSTQARELHAIQVTNGRRNGLRIRVSDQTAGLFDQ